MLGIEFGNGFGGGGQVFVPPPVAGFVSLLDFSIGVRAPGGIIASVVDQAGIGAWQAFGSGSILYNASPGLAAVPCADTRAIESFAYLQCPVDMSALLDGAAAHRFLVMQSAPAASQAGNGQMAANDGAATSGTLLPYLDGNFYDEFYSTTRQTVGALDAHTAPVVYDVVSSATEFTASRNGVPFFTTASNTVGASSSPMQLLGGAGGAYYVGQLSQAAYFPFKVTGTAYADLIAFYRTKGSGF
jgi:hypothetical protein